MTVGLWIILISLIIAVAWEVWLRVEQRRINARRTQQAIEQAATRREVKILEEAYDTAFPLITFKDALNGLPITVADMFSPQNMPCPHTGQPHDWGEVSERHDVSTFGSPVARSYAWQSCTGCEISRSVKPTRPTVTEHERLRQRAGRPRPPSRAKAAATRRHTVVCPCDECSFGGLGRIEFR